MDLVDWPMTIAGESATVKCPIGMKGSATRACNLNGQWEVPDPDCGMI